MYVRARTNFEIDTGLELALSPDRVALFQPTFQNGLVVCLNSTLIGYVDRLVLRCYNLTDSGLEIQPWQLVGHMYCMQVDNW